jgi:hypothetical protein
MLQELPASTMYSNFGYTNSEEEGQEVAEFIEAFIKACSKRQFKR